MIQISALFEQSFIFWALAESGGFRMARYKAYDLNGFRLISIGDIEAEADEEAVRIAKRQGKGDRIEIWEGQRKVRVVAPADTAGRA
jgi:hypothetical protein